MINVKVFSQSYNIDYYGIVSTEIDSNMAKMTSDLYYTQLTEINNFNISDKRTDVSMAAAPDPDFFSSTNLSFYTTITKNPSNDTWTTTYHVVDKQKNEIHSKQKIYDSFYKILMESKNILKETIKNLIENEGTSLGSSQNNDSFSNKSQSLASTEELSGTWQGEENINKIVILRGGRGFVIFKNGASMNVTVSLNEQSEIVVTQNGRTNASFYPELPRNIALQAAISAEPVTWILTMINENTLKGKKNTLITDGESYKQGDYEVIWNKTN